MQSINFTPNPHNKVTIIMLLLTALLIVACLFACSPQKRIARIAKRHPEVITRDTMFKIDKDTIPAVNVQANFKADTNTAKLDSIFKLFGGKMDSALALKLKSGVKQYIINRQLFPDTVIQIVDGFTIKLFQKGDNAFGVIIKKSEQIKEEKYAVVVNSIENKIEEIEWYEKLQLWIIRNSLWLFLLFWLLWKIFGKLLKARFPFLG